MSHKILVILLCIILCTVVVFGGVSLSIYQNRMDEVNNLVVQYGSSLSGQISSLESRFSTMEYNIQAMLDKQSSIIADYSVSYGKPDSNALTGKVTIKVIPKEYNDATLAELFIGDHSTEMIQTGNCFIGTLTVKITDAYTASVTFSENGAKRSEALPEVISYGQQIRNSLQVMSTSINGETGEDGYIYGTFSYLFQSSLGETAVSAKIVAVYNGEEVWSQSITDPGSVELPELTYVVGKELSEPNTYGDIYESYEAYIEVVGSYGFTYRYWVEGTEKQAICDQNGDEIIFGE